MSSWKSGEDGISWLPVERVLWARTNSAHYNHLHVAGLPRIAGDLDDATSRWTAAINVIVDELDKAFGEGAHWQSTSAIGAGWTHMGVYNPRYIAGTTTPSQHAFSNAIDIGPYYGVAGQQKFFDFLTAERKPTVDQFTEHEAKVLRQIVASLDSRNSNGSFAAYTVDHLRNHPQGESQRPAAEIRKIIADAINNG